jgi:hypothetical protein
VDPLEYVETVDSWKFGVEQHHGGHA